MRWDSPQILWLLLLVPVYYLWLYFYQRRARKRFVQFVSHDLWPVIAPEVDFRKILKKGRYWCLGFLFAVLALARPQWGMREEVMKVSGMDIMIVLDISNSMLAEDMMPNRLKKSRHWIKSFLEQLKGDRTGVVVFAGSSFVASPLTTDIFYLNELLQLHGPQSIQTQGTDIGGALTAAVRSLERGSQEGDPASQVVILISDGEDHGEGAREAAVTVKSSGIRLFVLGVGTPQGAPIPIRDESGELRGYKRSKKGEIVTSRLNPDALARIAAEAGGKYWTMSENEAEIDEMFQELGSLSRTDRDEKRVITYEERFQIPLFLSVLFFLIELSIPMRKMQQILKVFLLMIGFLGGLLGSPTDSRAAPVQSYLENKKGLQAFEAGKMEEAKQHFNEAQVRDPKSVELKYNQGVVQIMEGDVKNAEKNFDEASKEALEKGKGDLAARAFFNQAIAREKNKDIPSAVNSYLKSMELARQGKDKKLEYEARKNLELLLNQQNQQNQNQNQKDNKDQSKQQEQKEDQKEKNQAKPQYSRGQFKSEKLSKEDAERVMAELAEKEKQLREHIQKGQTKQVPQEMDW